MTFYQYIKRQALIRDIRRNQIKHPDIRKRQRYPITANCGIIIGGE